MSWVLAPGTAAYLGYDVNVTGNNGRLTRTTETLFTKVSYLFRLKKPRKLPPANPTRVCRVGLLCYCRTMNGFRIISGATEGL